MALRSASILLSVAALAGASTHVSGQEEESSLTWSKCEFKHEWPFTSTYECSKLSVPLDHTDESNEATLNLDLVKIKATNEPVLGSMLYNPGGPGSSGIENLFGMGNFLAAITNGQYDLVSFDPRGTGRNKPFSCANATAQSTEKRQEKVLDLPTSNLTESMEVSWPGYLQQAEACKAAHSEDGQHYGTVATARDMAKIVDALGGDRMLRYYGVSYGTLLGWTFAATFPERVERIIIDGNLSLSIRAPGVTLNPSSHHFILTLYCPTYMLICCFRNPVEYWSGYDIESVDAVDEGFQGIIEACVAHPDTCELAAEGDADTIITKLRTALETANDNPEALYTLKNTFFNDLYRASQYPKVAKLLAAFIKKGKTGLDAAVAAAQEEGGKEVKASDPSSEGKWEDPASVEKAKQAVTCSDWPLRAKDPSEVAWLIEQHSVVGTFVDAMAPQYWDCLVWPFDAVERYQGDFRIETKNPVLVANTRYDPVTPLKSARNSSSTLVGSVLLEHSGYGHGTSAHMSSCSLKAMRAYMTEGKLPDESTICDPDHELFSADFDPVAVLPPFLDEAKLVAKEGETVEEPEISDTDASTTASTTAQATSEPSGSSAAAFGISVPAIVGAVLLGISFMSL